MIKQKKCNHLRIKEGTNRKGYTGCVGGYDCEPCSHGYEQTTDLCEDCGVTRKVNSNGSWSEKSNWEESWKS